MILNQAEALEVSRDPFHTALDPSDILLSGQAAIVTGAGGGIGQGIALGLAKFGADVAVLDIDPERAERTAASISEMGRDSLVLPADVMDTDQVTAAVAQSADHFGHLNILVNNAGGVSARLFLEQSERSWRRHIDINLVSMLAATHAAAPVMKESGGGSIVNVTSIEGLRAAPMYAVYAACKAGMINFTMTMALELSEHHIRINAIAPDQTITPGLRGTAPGRLTRPPGPSAAPKAPTAPCTRSRRVARVLSRTARPPRCSSARRWVRTSPAPRSTSMAERTPRGWTGTPTEGWTLHH